MSQNNKDIRISTYVDMETAIELNKLAGKQSMAEFVRQILIEEVSRRNENDSEILSR